MIQKHNVPYDTAIATPALDLFISQLELTRVIENARHEDLGPDLVDVTTAACVPAEQTCDAAMVCREAGVLAGLAVLGAVAKAYDPRIVVTLHRHDGQAVAAGDTAAKLTGPKRSILTMERVALNLVTHLSGIATRTAAYVAEVAGTKAKICDTRKTLPGLRGLQKYAVACGGGTTHRLGLYDAMLIKDNHLAHLSADQLGTALPAMIADARRRWPELKFVEVEVDTLEQLEHALTLDVDYVLLDNMSPEMMKQAVSMRDESGCKAELEASGRITLDTVRAVAESGVERISVGALTHSVNTLDIGLDIG